MVTISRDKRKPKVISAAFQEEVSLVYEHCRSISKRPYSAGRPQVVEFGCMFGGLTCAALDGLNGVGVLDVFDNFIYRPWMDCFGLPFKDGESFQDIFLNAVKDYKNLYVHKVDYSENVIDYWSIDIDFLILDGIKDVNAAKNVIPRFLPFVPVGGYIFDQDIGYEPEHHYWMSLLYYGIRNYIELATLPWRGTGAMFRVKERIPKLLLEEICKFDTNVGIAIQYWGEFDIYNPDRTTWVGYNGNLGQAK